MIEKINEGYPVLKAGDKIKVNGIIWDVPENTRTGWITTSLIRDDNGRQYTCTLMFSDDFEIVK